MFLVLVLPSEAEVEAHNVSHLPFRSWCSACVRGRGLSLGHRRVDAKTKGAEQIPTISVDYGFFGQPEDRAHDTLPVIIVRDRISKGIWSHPVPSKGVVHWYPARALMADLDFMEYTRVIFKSYQEPSIIALCDAVENGWRVVQSVHGLARALKDFLEQRSGIVLESRSPLLAWLVEHCSNLLLFHKGEPHDGHTAHMRLKGKPWRVEMPNFGECVDFRRRTLHKLESRWSRGVFVGVRVKTIERIVMDETGTQSVRRVPEEQRCDNRLLRNVRGTPWEPNPGDVSTDLLEAMLIIPQLLDVEPTPTRVYNSDNKGTRNIYIRKIDREIWLHFRLSCV